MPSDVVSFPFLASGSFTQCKLHECFRSRITEIWHYALNDLFFFHLAGFKPSRSELYIILLILTRFYMLTDSGVKPLLHYQISHRPFPVQTEARSFLFHDMGHLVI